VSSLVWGKREVLKGLGDVKNDGGCGVFLGLKWTGYDRCLPGLIMGSVSDSS